MHTEKASNLDIKELQGAETHLATGEARLALATSIELLKSNSGSADVWSLVGRALRELNGREQAIEAFKAASTLEPDNTVVLHELGELMRLEGQIPDSLDIYRRLLELDDTDESAMKGMHESVLALGRLSTAELEVELPKCIHFYEQGLIADPTRIDLYYSLSHLYITSGRSLDSVTLLESLISILPDCPTANYNFAMALKDAGFTDKAIEHLKKVHPENSNMIGKVNHSMAHALLQKRNFSEGWAHYEARWLDDHFPSKNLDLLDERLPRWEGERDAKVLVWAEQGIGDEVMFLSALPDLMKCCDHVTVACDSRLIPIFERSFRGNVSFVSKKLPVIKGVFDAQLPMGSLPLFFRQDIRDFVSAQNGYLRPDMKTVDKIRDKLCTSKTTKIIGLSWFSNSTTHARLNRNTSLTKLIQSIGPGDHRFVCLQYGEVDDDLAETRRELGIEVVNPSDIDQREDIDNLCNLIAACDRVVTVDNVTVHLAGALGIPTTAFIPLIADWRWGCFEDSTYWYSSVKLHRQTHSKVWPMLSH